MKKMLLKLMTGMALGAVFGVLFAPQRGAKTRQQLARRTTQLKLKSRDVADRLRESKFPRRLAEGSRRAATGMVEALSSTSEQVRRMVRNAQEERNALEEMRPDTTGNPEWEDILDDPEGLRGEWDQDSGNSRVGGATWILAGVFLGVAIGVLVAPRAGEETREQLARKARQLRSMGEDTAARVVSKYR